MNMKWAKRLMDSRRIQSCHFVSSVEFRFPRTGAVLSSKMKLFRWASYRLEKQIKGVYRYQRSLEDVGHFMVYTLPEMVSSDVE